MAQLNRPASTDAETQALRSRRTMEVDDAMLGMRSPISERCFATLTVAGATGPGALHVLGTTATTIGRAVGSTVSLQDTGVSTCHARVVEENGKYVLEDLDSRNGTFVNGVRVTRHVLADGDRIRVGYDAQISVRYQDESELAATKRLYDSVVRDALTGAFNRRFFQERLLSEWAFALRHGGSLALLMIDLDHFKAVNDSFGHLGGDDVLRAVSTAITLEIRAEDVFARYGGEEFAVLARAIDLEQAVAFGERLRRVVEALRIPLRSSPIGVTASFGAAVARGRGPIADPLALIAKADAALYEAKSLGRNRVIAAREY